jgi:hypothetical protein
MRSKPIVTEAEPEPARLVTINEVHDHAPEPAVTAEPAPAKPVLATLKAFRPSGVTRTFGAHLGRHANHLIAAAEMSFSEGLYALRQIRDDAIGAAAKAYSTNDTDGLAAATADVEFVNNLIARIA